MTYKYFNVKNGLTTGDISLNASNGNIQANTLLANIKVTSSANLGAVGNVIITGGTNGQVLSTDGSGTLSWYTVPGVSGFANISNGNSNVNIPVANGNVNISAVGNANILVVTGTGANVTGTFNTTGNIVGQSNLSISGNALISGNLTVDGNVTYIDVTNLSVEDPIIQLQSGPNGAAPIANTGKDVGTALNYYDTQAQIAFMGWDVSNAEFGLASQASITSEVVTFTNYGNLRVANIIGNGQALTGITGANVTGQVANALVAGTVYTAAQPNITSTGTLSSLSVSGNANTGNLGTTGVFATTLSTTGNANVGNIVATNIVGTLETGSQTNITAVGTLASLSVSGNANVGNLGFGSGLLIGTGNINAGNLSVTGTTTVNDLTVTGNLQAGDIGVSSISNGTSNVDIVGVGGNVTTSVNGNANILVVTDTGANINGYLSVSGNATVGNISATNIVGTLTTGSQTNITAVGTLASLSVSGNANTGNLGFGSGIISGTGNITAGYFIGDGSQLTNISAGSILANGNSNVNIPTANGNVNISAVGNANILVVTGTGANITGTLSVSSNANVGNLGATNIVGTLTTGGQTNITSVGTLASLSVSGNANIGNLGTTGVFATTLSATGNANVGNLGATNIVGTLETGSQTNITAIGTLASLSVSGNANVGNLGTGGLITSSGKVIAGAVSYSNTDGTNGQVLTTYGNGITYWSTVGSGISNGTSNVNISAVNGNITMSVAGNANILTVTGTGIVVSGNSNLGSNGNVIINGGTNGSVLTTDGSGNLSWTGLANGNVIVDTFTGNGVQTNFTLSSTPTNEDYILVNIDGVLQLHSAYTISGTTLTLSQAPVNGAALEVQSWNMGPGAGLLMAVFKSVVAASSDFADFQTRVAAL